MIEALHFLRPLWFLMFIPLLIILVLIWRRRLQSVNWKAVCDEQLLPHILTQTGHRSSRAPLITAALATSLCIIAAAGPVIQKLPQPVYKEQSALVILLDLSQSMNATDLRPSRLARARLKLLDLLKTRKAGQTALLVYAADTFVVTPLTDDTNTISNLVPTLETSLMPSQGSHAHIALKKSAELFKQAGIRRGHVLLMTDGLRPRDLEAIDELTASHHRISIMGLGTADGGPVPVEGGFLQDSQGAIVIPRLETGTLKQAAQRGHGLYVNLQADDSDLDRLKPLFESRKVEAPVTDSSLNPMELTADSWKEEGPWLLLLVIPLAALWPRRGWLLCLPLFIMPIPEPAMAVDTDVIKETSQFNLDHLWSRADQKAMNLFNQGEHHDAASQFEDPRWKASAHYRAGEYEAALNTMSEAQNSDDFYNRANALAQLGKYQEALEAYDSALELDENNEDAHFNREQVKQHLDSQQQSSQQPSDENQPSDDQSSDKQDSQQQDSQQQQSSKENNEPSEENNQQQAQSSEQQDDQAEKDQNEKDPAKQNQQSKSDEENDAPKEQEEASAEEVNQAIKDAQQQQNEKISESDDGKDDKEQQQTFAMEETLPEHDPITEQWLRRIPDDPGLLLKRKFLYQYQREPDPVTSEQPW